MKRILMTLVLASQFLAPAGFASDYGREKKWADEVVPGVVVGDAVYLEQADKHKFLTLYTPVKDAKSAVIVVHGLGIHPDWGLVGVLRSELADAGYTTLSVQMPILHNEAKGSEYPATFPEAAERLKLAVEFLKEKGYASIALVSHSMGSRMGYAYLSGEPDPAVKAWVAIGMGADENFGALRLPVLDLHGERDFPEVLANAAKRKQALAGKAGSRQQAVPGAGHFFEGFDNALIAAVAGYLKETLGN